MWHAHTYWVSRLLKIFCVSIMLVLEAWWNFPVSSKNYKISTALQVSLSSITPWIYAALEVLIHDDLSIMPGNAVNKWLEMINNWWNSGRNFTELLYECLLNWIFLSRRSWASKPPQRKEWNKPALVVHDWFIEGLSITCLVFHLQKEGHVGWEHLLHNYYWEKRITDSSPVARSPLLLSFLTKIIITLRHILSIYMYM